MRFIAALALMTACLANAADGEYAKHFGVLGKLSIAVAEAMPAHQYGFRHMPNQ
jgi:hypothetical protein